MIYQKDLFYCVKKLYFTNLLIIFKKHHLPKCIVKHFIENYTEFNTTCIKVNQLYLGTYRAPMATSHTESSYHKYPYFFNNGLIYSNIANTRTNCLVTNFKKSYLSSAFTKDDTYYAYELNKPGLVEREKEILIIMDLYSAVFGGTATHFKKDVIALIFFDAPGASDLLAANLEKIVAYLITAERIRNLEENIESMQKGLKRLKDTHII